MAREIKYPLVKKAYLVGLPADLPYYQYPESPCEVVLVDAKDSASKAIGMYAKRNYEPFTSIRARRFKVYDAYDFEGKPLCLNAIHNELERRRWHKEMKELRENNPGSKVYIHSGQWGAYWRAGACGYTSKISEAGIYDIEEAWRCVSHCGIEKKISFELLTNTPNY